MRVLIFFVGMLFAVGVWASFTPFEVKDIKLEGLQRISAGTVFNSLPIRIGEIMDAERSVEAIRELFKTGFFEDVRLSREDGVLVVAFVERPSIADIKLSGNKDIDSEQLTDALKQIGLSKGRTFNRSLLDQVEQELQRQYFSRGKYGVKIKSTVNELERNRVDIGIEVFEGAVAKISQINIVGNSAFSDETLLGRFQLGARGTFALFSSRDQYSKQKLSADLEALKSFYLDRGFINFHIASTQVSITPDKRSVYVTINVQEGEKYTVKDVKLAGDLVVSELALRPLISIKRGDVFSRRAITDSSSRLSDRFGEEGYAFSNINPVPDINNETREVSLTFFVDPGKRIYVRRINVSGNTQTKDEVIRREFRQMEGAWIATNQVNRSRVRLQRLGYFEDVNVETPAVPGVEDQVDVNFSVTERSTGSLQAGIGYSESQGVLLTANISHNNFFGTGKRVSAEINTSSVNTIYSFSYTNPYYTLDGVSRGFRGFYRKTDSGARNTADYNADTYGIGIDYGIPLSEFNRFRFGFSLEHTTINTTPATPQAYRDFLEANTDDFDAVIASAGWSYDSRNRAIFPNRGTFHNIGAEIAVPGSGLQYYKITSRSQWFQPLTRSLTFSLRGQVGYGDGYGGTSTLPFFENFYAGGVRTVRGFRANSLGPKEGGDPLGGALKVVGNAEIIFPVPFNPEAKAVQLSAFYDIGSVYENADDFDVSELRASVGLSLTWLSPIGPMVFSLAEPVRSQLGDETESFQFSLGAPL